MSKPESSAPTILKNTEDIKDLLNKMDAKINSMATELANLKETSRTDIDLLQTHFEQVKTSLTQIAATSSGAKKPVKSVEEKSPADKETKETKETKESSETKETKETKKTKETLNQFFLRRSKESPEFKAKYDNEEIRKLHDGKKVQCPALHVLQKKVGEHAALLTELEQEHKNGE
jgi:hypothetical protein